MKKNYFLFLLFSLTLSFSYAQKKKEATDTAYNRQIKVANNILWTNKRTSEKITALDSLLATGNINIPSIVGGLYNQKAVMLCQQNGDALRESADSFVDPDENGNRNAADTTGDYLYLPIKNAFQKAMDTCKKCRLNYVVDRYEYLEDFNFEPGLIKKDLEVLKEHGYKQQYNAAFLSAYTRMGNYTWYGLEASVIGIHVPAYRIWEKDSVTKKKNVISSMYPVLAYTPAVAFEIKDGKNYGFNFSLVQWTAPLSFNFTRFGFIKTENVSKAQWFYRPEIGLGWNYFSVAYAYNLMLKKADRVNADKHFFVARITVPLFKRITK